MVAGPGLGALAQEEERPSLGCRVWHCGEAWLHVYVTGPVWGTRIPREREGRGGVVGGVSMSIYRASLVILFAILHT